MPTTSNFAKLLGENLRFIRNEKGLTQEGLAEIAGISRAPISEIENGNRNAKLDTLEKIIAALEIAPHELFSFGQLGNFSQNKDKNLLIDVLRDFLKGRDIKEVQYALDVITKLFDIIDNK